MGAVWHRPEGGPNRRAIRRRDGAGPSTASGPARRPHPPILTGVNLTPTEVDRLLLHLAALLARSRRERGLLLNVPEATAIIADAVAEAARDGRTHAGAMAAGRAALGADDVLPGVADILTQVHVEAVFDDGSRLVSVSDPIGGGHLGEAAPGALLAGEHRDDEGTHIGGATRVQDTVTVAVVNEADVPISVSSHFHFFETNPRLRFDRAAAYGRHLDVPAGSTVAFPPGEPVEVALVPISGARVVVGFAGLVDGPLDAPGAREAALAKARACGFADSTVVPGAEPADPDSAVRTLVSDLAAQRGQERGRP
jgi:urease subunit gamma/beta